MHRNQYILFYHLLRTCAMRHTLWSITQVLVSSCLHRGRSDPRWQCWCRSRSVRQQGGKTSSPFLFTYSVYMYFIHVCVYVFKAASLIHRTEPLSAGGGSRSESVERGWNLRLGRARPPRLSVVCYCPGPHPQMSDGGGWVSSSSSWPLPSSSPSS